MNRTSLVLRTVGGINVALHARVGANRIKAPISVSRSPLLNGKRIGEDFVPKAQRVDRARYQVLQASRTRAKDERFYSRKHRKLLRHAAWYRANYRVMQQLHPGHAKLCALGLRTYLAHDSALRMKFFTDLLDEYVERCERLFHTKRSSSKMVNKNRVSRHKEMSCGDTANTLTAGCAVDQRLLSLFSESERAHLKAFNFRTMIFPDEYLLSKLEDPASVERIQGENKKSAIRWLLSHRHSAPIPPSLCAFRNVDIDAKIKRAQRQLAANDKLNDTPPIPAVRSPMMNKNMQLKAFMKERKTTAKKNHSLDALPKSLLNDLAIEKKLRRKLRLAFYQQPGVFALHSNMNNFCLVQRNSRDSPLPAKEIQRLWAKAKETGEDAEYKLNYVKPKEVSFSGNKIMRGSKLYHQYRANEAMKKVLERLTARDGSTGKQPTLSDADALMKAHEIVQNKLPPASTTQDFTRLSRLQRAAFFFHHPQSFLKHSRHLTGFDAYYFRRRLEEGYSNIDGIKADGYSLKSERAEAAAKAMSQAKAGINKGMIALKEMNEFKKKCKAEWLALSPDEQNGYDEHDESVAAQFPLVKRNR